MQGCCSNAGRLNDTQRRFYENPATRPDLVCSGCPDAPPLHCQGCPVALLKDNQLCVDAQSSHFCCMAAADVPRCEVVLSEQRIFSSLHCHVGI